MVVGSPEFQKNISQALIVLFTIRTIHQNVIDIYTYSFQVLVPDSNLIVIGVYRSPDGNLEWFLDSLEKLVLSLENRRTKNNLVLGGDVNIDILKAYDLYRDNKTPDSELRYKTIKKQYKQKLLSARLERNARFIESASNRCAAAWKVIHEEGAPSKSQLISSVTAEAFNAHFIDSVQQTRDAINGSATSALDMLEKRDPAASRFNITLLSWESVIRMVQKLNNSPSKDIFEFGTCQSLNSKRG
ncbi:uncharacterized protein LOC128984904 [Macrosteles quadrilineatus]|uniref:uncharacterized protein LOC128984904 n=1 Tax=Macrosteles quadrilineatus TaxID=74068 RepID=UPI0023E15647|nr:uncharacterized protein LOC128984904 [Macrosteles quadrilineatus]